MIAYSTALDLLLQQARSFGVERIGIDLAAGRVLTEPIAADRDYPPFDRATMDGYAIRSADITAGITRFRIIESIFAGGAASLPAGKGDCYKIMTGAPVPPGFDIVIRREDTLAEDTLTEDTPTDVKHTQERNAGAAHMEIRVPGHGLPRNIAGRGEDLRLGESVIGPGTHCTPAIIGMLASLGRDHILVESLPRVAILTTGNEVVGIGQPIGPYQIRNSNQWFLRTALQAWGIEPVRCDHLPDRREQLSAALEQALQEDIVILTGGVSAGDADYVPGVLAALGVRQLFHKIAIKPGKPVWCGVTSSGTIVIGLPGNPFSCLTGYSLLIRPFLHACFGLPAPLQIMLPLAGARKKKTPLEEFFPVRIAASGSHAEQIPLNGSGDIRLGLGAQALGIHPATAGDLEKGDLVTCILLSSSYL